MKSQEDSQLGVHNGIADLNTIRHTYNSLSEGYNNSQIAEGVYGSRTNPAFYKGKQSGKPVEAVVVYNPKTKQYDTSKYMEYINPAEIQSSTKNMETPQTSSNGWLKNLINNLIEENPITSSRRVRNYQKAMDSASLQGRDFSQQNDMFNNILEFSNIASAGIPNRLSATQNIGLVIDAAQGDNIMQSWFGNSGIVSDNFAQNHPYWTFGINLLGDVGLYGSPIAGKTLNNKLIKPYRLSREMNQAVKTSEISTAELPSNVGWGPRQTISVTHKSDKALPLSLYNESRWDVVNENANPLGIWFQGRFGIPRSTNTGATLNKAQKALKARQLFSRRPYTHSGDLTLDKPLVTVGDVPDRSLLSYKAEQMGADGLIYNNVYDNGYDANQVILSFKQPFNYMLTTKAYKGGPEISNVPTIDIRQSLVNQYNTNKYIRLLGKAKDSDQFKGSIKDRSIVTRPFAEYLEKLGINSSLFTEKDLNTLMQMRSKSVQRTIPQTGRSAISYEMKPKNQQTIFSIDINENGTTLGEISARSHNPNHPRANEVPIDMVSRVEVSPSRGLSEDAYNAAIDYVKQTGIGEGLVSGERLLSPEITYNVWKHYPNRQLLRTNGHHTFGTGRDVVGQPVSETHKGPVVMLTEPSKTPLPMKSNSIFHPDMIKDGKLLPPDWTKYGIYYSLPLLLGTYGMFTNKKAN